MIYSLIEDELINEDGGLRKTYGIAATDSDGNVSAERHGIISDKPKAENLVNLCNESKLELCHLSDVIEDFLF